MLCSRKELIIDSEIILGKKTAVTFVPAAQ